MNKYALALLLGSAAAKNNQVDKVNVKQVEDIVGGFLKGALDAEGFDDITKCIQDGEHIITDVESAVGHFEKKDAKDVIAGLEDIADLASDELTGGYDVVKGERVKIQGFLEDFALSKEEADELIMSARNIVYKD